MDLKEAILNRRTIREYNQEPVTREEIIELLNVAVYAPTHHLRQSWRFVIIDGEEKDKLVNHLNDIYQGVDPKVAKLEDRKKSLQSAQLILVVINEKEHPDPIWMLEEYGAASALIQNFQLLAYEKGIGVCWKSHFFIDEQGKYIGVKDHEMVSGVLTIGRFDKEPSVHPRIKAEEKLEIYQFDDYNHLLK